MSGDTGDSPARLTGGELILHLLQNPPQHPKPHPHQPLPHDPAVAAVGPTLPFPSDLPFRPTPFAPHNFFIQSPSPSPSPSWSSPNQPPPGFNHHFDPNPNPLHHQQPNLMFGSFPFKIRNDNLGLGPSNGKLEALGNRRFNGFAAQPNPTHEGGRVGNYKSVIQPPPGFSAKIGNNAASGTSFDQKVDKGKSKFAKLNIRGGGLNDNEERETERERDALELHDEGGQREIDDLEEQLMGTVLEEGSVDKKDRKKKEYRSDKRGQWLLNQRMRNLKRLTECRSDIDRLNAPFLEIFESLIPAEEEKAKQKKLLALLEKHVTKEWPNARLHLYGSCANSFGFRKSDLDVCLAIEDADVNKAEILLKLADILQSDNLQNVQALTRARVPIVKLMDPATGISCDICVNNVLAVVNTKLLRDYAQIDVRLRPLAFIVKHWAKSRGVNETYQGTLSSYAYVLMCIHFLQQRRPAILPCLQGMERTYAVMFENVECAYFDQVEKLYGFGSRNGETIAQLVWAFFKYWAYCHDYANDVISIRTGSILSKRMKDWTRRIGNDRHLICIEDPFEVSHDLGRVVDKFSIRVLREEFERAAEIMQYDPSPCIKLFEPYVPS